jgi:hypothetical protein
VPPQRDRGAARVRADQLDLQEPRAGARDHDVGVRRDGEHRPPNHDPIAAELGREDDGERAPGQPEPDEEQDVRDVASLCGVGEGASPSAVQEAVRRGLGNVQPDPVALAIVGQGEDEEPEGSAAPRNAAASTRENALPAGVRRLVVRLRRGWRLGAFDVALAWVRLLASEPAPDRPAIESALVSLDALTAELGCDPYRRLVALERARLAP